MSPPKEASCLGSSSPHLRDLWPLTHGFDGEALWRPQSPAHPRLPQHLQMTAIPLNEKNGVLHPTLKVHLSHGFHQSFIPEAAQVLGLKIHKDLLPVGVVGAAASSSSRAVLLPPQHHSQRGCWQLHHPLLLRHYSVVFGQNMDFNTLSSPSNKGRTGFSHSTPQCVSFLQPRRTLSFSSLPSISSVGSSRSHGNHGRWRYRRGRRHGARRLITNQ